MSFFPAASPPLDAALVPPLALVEGHVITMRDVELTDEEMDMLRAIAARMKENER